MTHQKFFVTKQDGTLLIDGIGYCFPDKSQTKPKPNTYIQVTEVKAIEKNGKKFGFYKWEPADNTISEESLIEAYLANPRPAFLLSQIERMPLEKGEAIVLRHTEWHYRGRSCTVAGLSLNGWPEAEVSVRANTVARARKIMPSTPYFEDGRTMLDLLLQHGYGVVSDEDIFAAIKDTVNNPNSSLAGEVPYGTIYRGLYHNRPITFVSRNMLSWYSSAALILKGLPVLYVEGFSEDINKKWAWELRAQVTRFVATCFEQHCAENEMLKDIEPAPISISPAMPQDLIHAADDPAKGLPTLPNAVRKALEQGLITGNCLYPNYWVFKVPDEEENPPAFCRLFTSISKEDYKDLFRFVKEMNKLTAEIVNLRRTAIAELVPLNFDRIYEEVDCYYKHSELLDYVLEGSYGFHNKSWNGIEYIKTEAYSKKEDAMISDYSASEIRAIVAEINTINRAAEQRIRSAIAKGKLPVSAVVGKHT